MPLPNTHCPWISHVHRCGSSPNPSFRGFYGGLIHRQWHPTPVLLPGKYHGCRGLVGCSPWGHEESDMTERLHFHFSLSYIGEGNGNPLQCSCLENPRDGRAWWAAVYGVAWSRTRLKRLSSSSSSMIVLFLGFWGTSMLFSTMMTPVFLPAVHVGSLCSAPSWALVTSCPLDGRSDRYEWCLIRVWLAFLRWLVKLLAFSCACWPSVRLGGKCCVRSSAQFLVGLCFSA